jgi:hypothetical protein
VEPILADKRLSARSIGTSDMRASERRTLALPARLACGGGARSGMLSWRAVVHHREVDYPQAVKRVDQCLSRMQ